MDRISRLCGFLEDTVVYFLAKANNVDHDRYFADREIRSILNKATNNMILSIVELSEECLRKMADQYRIRIVTSFSLDEFLGDIVLKMAPLVKHRNELVHQYLKVNWQNITTAKSRIPT